MALFGNQGSHGCGGENSDDDVRVECGNQGSRCGGGDSVDDVRVELGKQGSHGGDDDRVDDMWVESISRRGCSVSSGDGDIGGDSGSACSEYGVDSLGTKYDVCVFKRGDGMASPPSGNLFVDTAALSDQDNLQSAVALFARYPHLFKSNSASGNPLYVAASQDSTKCVATCAPLASLEADDMAALDVFDQHPFQPIAKDVDVANSFKQVVPPKKEEHAPVIKSLMKKLGGLPSCYNKKCYLSTNCMFIMALEDYDVAAEDICILASMSKK
jgi:hypothetical protein